MGDLPKMSTWGTKGQKYEICDKEAREQNTQLGKETESIRNEVEALKQMSATAVGQLKDDIAEEVSARQTADNALTARIDTFTSLASGSTTGDAELNDIRVGYDGTIYSSAGTAVRRQVSELRDDLTDISEERNFVPIDVIFRDNVGKLITPKGHINTDALYSISNLIPVELGNIKIRITFKKENPYISRIAFLRKNVLSKENVISTFVQGSIGTFDVEIPSDAKYIAISSDTDSNGHTENEYPKVRFFPSLVNVDELDRNIKRIDEEVQDISEKLTDGIVESSITLVYEKYANKYVNTIGSITTSTLFPTSNPIEITDGMKSIRIEVEVGNTYISRITFLSSDILDYGHIVSCSVDASTPIAEYEIPTNAKYFCVAKDVDSSGNAHGDYPHVTALIVKKSVISELTDRVEKVENEILRPTLNIGSTLYAIVGDTMQIFKDSIVDSFGNNYICKFECVKGRQYLRYWEYTPTASDIGETTLKISLVNASGDVIDEKTVSLITKQASNTKKNVLNIGDSTMVNGEIPIELSRRLKGTNGVASTPSPLSLSNINVVGRLKNTDNSVGWEGTGGWTYSTYISSGSKAVRFVVNNASAITIGDLIRIDATNTYGYYQFQVAEVNVSNGTGNIRAVFHTTAYTEDFASKVSTSGAIKNTSGSIVGQYTSCSVESYQPFWNSETNSFDITSYVRTYCGGSVDFVFILLGINSLYGMSPWSDTSNIMSQCKTLLRNIHKQLPSAKVLLSTNHLVSQNGGLGANYDCRTSFGQFDVSTINHLLFEMNKKYYTLENDPEFRGYVKVVNTHAQFDAENAFPSMEKNVNTRATKKESVGTNGVHPTNSGYWQISDAEFRALLAN